MADIRSAVSADVPAIQRVARVAWQAAYGGFVADSAIEEMLEEWYSDEAVERGVTNDDVVYLVAESEGRGDDEVIGYASAGGTDDDDGTAVLASIYVLPDRWGEGVGSVLLDGAMERLRDRGFDCLRATVLADNEVGVAFYDRRGFERVAEREQELRDDRHDALVLERPL